jgi:hypothetical protein
MILFSLNSHTGVGIEINFFRDCFSYEIRSRARDVVEPEFRQMLLSTHPGPGSTLFQRRFNARVHLRKQNGFR